MKFWIEAKGCSLEKQSGTFHVKGTVTPTHCVLGIYYKLYYVNRLITRPSDRVREREMRVAMYDGLIYMKIPTIFLRIPRTLIIDLQSIVMCMIGLSSLVL